MITFNKKEKGFALLIAVMVSGLFLIIGTAILKIVTTQLILSSTAKESQAAIYAADTGSECALYWERKYLGGSSPGLGAFSIYDGNGVSNRADFLAKADPDNKLYCVGNLSPITMCPGGDPACPGIIVPGSTNYQSSFRIDNISGTPACVDVTVNKYVPNTEDPASTLTEPVKTVIIARGYNTCNETNPRRVERALRVTLE